MSVKKIIFIVVIPVLILRGAFWYYSYTKKWQIAVTNYDACIKAKHSLGKTALGALECITFDGKRFSGVALIEKRETEEEIIQNYKAEKYGVIAEQRNPYNTSESVVILSSFLFYKDYEEPPPQSCGMHSSACYILFKNDNKITLLYRADSGSTPQEPGSMPTFLPGDLFDDKKDPVPLIIFLDKENIIIKVSSGDVLSGSRTFSQLNTRTKESKDLSSFLWSVDEGMPTISFSKNKKMISFSDNSCFYPSNKSLETVCDNKITMSVLGKKARTFVGDLKKAIEKMHLNDASHTPFTMDASVDFSFDLKENISNGNVLVFQIKSQKYVYHFDTDALEESPIFSP